MPIDVKMGVSGIAQFKTAMGQARDSVKTLDAELKLNEKQFQATGDKETYMANKSKLLQQQIAEQNKVVKEGQNALKAMEKQGVDPASQAYQRMQRDVVNAQAALLDMNGALDTVGQSTEETAQKTDKLTSSLNSINKKVSFDAVLGGIGKITDGMEAAGRKIEAMARDVWQNIVDAATWADDVTTLSSVYDIPVERLQAMQKVAANEIQTSVEAISKSQQKLKQNLASNSKEFQSILKELGVATHEWGPTGWMGNPTWVQRDWEDIYWDLGEALKNYNDEVFRADSAQKTLGREWKELNPLFDAGREKYEAAVAAQIVVNAENVAKLNELSGTIKNVQQDFETLKESAWAQLAPAFNEVGKSVADLLGRFNEYLESPEGQEKLGELSQAVTDLFSGLSDVDFGQALDSAKGILDDIIGALKWINEHSGDVLTALETIGGGFLALKAAEVVGTLVQGASALKNLLGGGSAAAAGGGAATASSAAAGAEAATITKITTGSKLLDALGIGALLKTAKEASEQLGTGLWGYWAKKQQMQEMTIAGFVDPDTGKVYSVEEWNAMQGTASQPVGEPKHPKNITGTASAESMQGYVERTVEDIYDDLYKAINDYDPETNIQEKTLFFENVLKPLAAEAMQAGNVPLEEMDEIAALFKKKFLDSFEDDWEGTTGGLLNILQEAIDEKAQGVKLTLDPIIPDDTVGKLQETLDSYDLYLRVTPIMGALSTLAAGVSGSSAGASKSYNNTSNVYFGNVNVNNGMDADVLAAQIAASTKQAMAGFGG